MKKLAYFSLVFAALFGFAPVTTFASGTNIEKISIGRICSEGETICEANGDSLDSVISQDGRFVVFSSYSTNLIHGDTTGGFNSDVFILDKTTNKISRVNVATDGSQTGGHNNSATMSNDNLRVVYSQGGTLLARILSEPGNAATGTIDIRQINVSPEGNPPNNFTSSSSFLSGNGRFAAFSSTASNLVPNDTNGTCCQDIFVRDIDNNTTERVNLSPDGAQMLPAVGECVFPVISQDGRYVAFSCYQGALFANSPDGVYLRDRIASTTSFVAGAVGKYTSVASMSRDGKYITYYQITSDSQSPDGYSSDVFMKNLETGLVQKASVASDGTAGNSWSTLSAISDDGRYVVFYSKASNLIPNDTNGVYDVFIHDVVTGQTARVSETNGIGGNNNSYLLRPGGSISGDGKYVVFDSWATNLGSWVDTNTHHDGSSGFDVFLATNPLFVSNNAPVFDPIGNQQVDENQSLQFSLSATDPDSDTVTLSVENLPTGAIFDSLTGSFSWTPSYSQVEDYTVRFIATDDGSPVASSTLDVLITVNNVNRAPVLDLIGDKMIDENLTLQFTVTATDPDGDALVYSASNLPAGATFNPSTGIFSWTPGYGQAGNYTNVEFTATDNGSPMQLDTKLITITVNDINRPPVFTAIGSQEVSENQPLAFTVSATDPDGNPFVLSATNLPSGSAFNTSTGIFSWTPNYSQAGAYVVDFAATDNGTPTASSVLQVVITVGDVPTPTEQAGNLINVVVDYSFPTAVENSYLANLRKVPKFIEEGKITSAINQLDAFIQKVNHDLSSGLISQAEADQLITLANALKSDLGN